MGKFAIECPKCGSLNQASTSVFAKKKLKCGNCGGQIDIRASRFASKKCGKCGSVVVCDQAKMKDKRCPVCGEPLTPLAATARYSLVKVKCPQCGCSVEADKTKQRAVCPICSAEFDVKQLLLRAELAAETGISVIRYEGDNETFIWKHPIEDFNAGSRLIVHESQEAVLFLSGEALDSFGPGAHVLQTQTVPLLRSVYRGGKDEQSPFHSEIYFVNKTVQMGIKWGTDSRVNFVDPVSEIPLDLGARGELSLQISEPRKVLTTLVGTESSLEGRNITEGSGARRRLAGQFKALLLKVVKENLAQVIVQQKLDVLNMDAQLGSLSDICKEKLNAALSEFGFVVPQFVVSHIDFPQDNENFQKIKALRAKQYIGVAEKRVEADITAAEREATLARKQTEYEVANFDAEIKKKQAEAEAYETEARGRAEAAVMRAKGYDRKDEIDAEVQKAYAEGIGNFSSGSDSGGGIAHDMIGLIGGMKIAEIVSEKLGDQLERISGERGGAHTGQNAWVCPKCGYDGNRLFFCGQCGARKPWTCECGHEGNTEQYCEACGKKQEETKK